MDTKCEIHLLGMTAWKCFPFYSSMELHFTVCCFYLVSEIEVHLAGRLCDCQSRHSRNMANYHRCCLHSYACFWRSNDYCIAFMYCQDPTWGFDFIILKLLISDSTRSVQMTMIACVPQVGTVSSWKKVMETSSKLTKKQSYSSGFVLRVLRRDAR